MPGHEHKLLTGNKRGWFLDPLVTPEATCAPSGWEGRRGSQYHHYAQRSWAGCQCERCRQDLMKPEEVLGYIWWIQLSQSQRPSQETTAAWWDTERGPQHRILRRILGRRNRPFLEELMLVFLFGLSCTNARFRIGCPDGPTNGTSFSAGSALHCPRASLGNFPEARFWAVN